MEIDQNHNRNNFLQSDEWKKFQKAAGRKTFFISSDDLSASIVEHKLPIIGKYFYVPRGPVIQMTNDELQMTNFFEKIIDLAKNNNIGWVRIEPEDEKAWRLIKKNIKHKILKAPHDMQPKENFVIDIAKAEEELLSGMKQKTRYNLKLSQRLGVSVKVVSSSNCHPEFNSGSLEIPDQVRNDKKYYINKFIDLIKLTENRKDIKFHSASYYQKMIEIIPENILKLYIAEYKGKIIATNLVIFYGDTATYLHGATDDEYRNVMAPYLLQWQAIKDAKKLGYKFYDFGGIKTTNNESSWAGITKFKLGFSPNTKTTVFPGSYDIVINNCKYLSYKIFSLFFGFYSKLIR